MSILVYTRNLAEAEGLAEFAGQNEFSGILRLSDSPKVRHTKEDKGLIILGLSFPPELIGNLGDLPLALYLSKAAFEQAKSQPEVREALCLAGQRADIFFAENDNVAHRLIGALGLLGRLNRKHADTKLVHLWPLNAVFEPNGAESDVLLAWLEHPNRSDDAYSNWPRLGGDRMDSITVSRRWIRPRSWIRKILSGFPSN